MRRALRSALLVACLVMSTTPDGEAQRAGTIRGHVAVPEPAPAPLRPAVSRLGASARPAIDRRQAVVYLESAPRAAFGELPAGRARLDQRGERFIPHVLAVTVGTVVDFPNNDTTYHNVFSLSQPRTFDLGRYAPGRTGSVRFDRPGIVPVFCDIHSPMSAYILVFSHPFFDVTDDDGAYEITGVPPGDYTLLVWSELGEAPPRLVTVVAGQPAVVDFEVGRSGS
jgi:plastocyanin